METLVNLTTILLPLLIGYIFGRNRDNNKTIFNKKLEIYSDIVYYVNSHKYQINLGTDEIIKLFAPARLIGSKTVVDELRKYFSLISEYHSTKKEEDIKKHDNDILKSTMELEQLMRKDLRHFRSLSRDRISLHLKQRKKEI